MMTTNHSIRELGSIAIQAAHPAGANVREHEDYMQMQMQMERLTDIHADILTDWQEVIKLGSNLLLTQGKDLAVGTWLALGLLHTQGISGLSDGIAILNGLIGTHWDDMTPAARRIRGRRNQMQWWLEQIHDLLNEKALMSLAPIPADQHAQMLQDWSDLSDTWDTHDDEPPAFYSLKAVLERLPVQSEPEAESNSQSLDTQSQNTQSISPVTTDSRSTSEPELTAAPVTTAVNTPDLSAPSLSALSLPDTPADLVSVTERALTNLQPLASWLLDQNPEHPLAYRINRICAWTTLETLPVANDGITRLLEPTTVIRDNLAKVIEGGDVLSLIRFAESRLVTTPCWLDLNHLSFKALTELGYTQAARAIADETAWLIRRLPGLEALHFAHDMPFAQTQTQEWLATLKTGATSAASGASHVSNKQSDASESSLQSLKKDALAKARSGELSQAIESLQSAFSATSSASERFKVRLAQCELIHQFDRKTDLRPMILPIVEDLKKFKLPIWEPELASQAYALIAGIELRHDAESAHAATQTLGQLSRTNLFTAWQMSQPSAS